MRIGFKTSLKNGRSIMSNPTKHIFPDLRRIQGGKKEELTKIMENKPVVDSLIEKVGRIKLKDKKEDTQKELVKQQREYAKKLNKKPKKRISLEF
jgi:hypothetical protein